LTTIAGLFFFHPKPLAYFSSGRLPPSQKLASTRLTVDVFFVWETPVLVEPHARFGPVYSSPRRRPQISLPFAAGYWLQAVRHVGHYRSIGPILNAGIHCRRKFSLFLF
jgi:hypothetical protein